MRTQYMRFQIRTDASRKVWNILYFRRFNMLTRIKNCKTLDELYALRREIVMNDKNYNTHREWYHWKLEELTNKGGK